MRPEAYREAYRPAPCERPESDEQGEPTLSTISATVAAALACEGLKLLMGMHERAAIGTEMYWDALNNAFFTSSLTRNRQCLFDHAVVPEESVIELPGPAEVTLAEVHERAAQVLGSTEITLDLGREPEAALSGAGPREDPADRQSIATLAQLGVPQAEIVAARNGRRECYLQIGAADAIWREGARSEGGQPC
jgi:hypothetical protein